MEEMQMLFDVGVQMVDASRKEKFTLKAIIFVTITDYIGLFSLSGQIKGKTGYVICIDRTCYTYLKGSNKIVYTRHRWFLVKKHRYRRSVMNEYFDNQEEPQCEQPKPTSWGQRCMRWSRTWIKSSSKRRRRSHQKRGHNRQGSESGTRRRKHLLLSPPFLSRRSQFSSSTCLTRKH
jgi:hypothetical protein